MCFENGIDNVESTLEKHPYCDNRIGILLPKLFWPIVRENCSSDWTLKCEAEGREFAKFMRTLEQFTQAVKGQFLVTELVPGSFSYLINYIEQL